MATGKISRLPREIREQVNQKLDAGEPGNRLVIWLNELPAVRALLAAEFGGAAIKEQNLTNWKQGGFREWRLQKEVQAFAQQPAGTVSVVTPEQLSTIVAVRYLAAVREWQLSPVPAERRWRQMRVILRDVLKLQRQGQLEQRLELEQEKLQFAMERFEEGKQSDVRRVMTAFLVAAKQWPEVQEALAGAFRLLQERKGAAKEGNEAELGPIKVNQGDIFSENEAAQNETECFQADCGDEPSPPRRCWFPDSLRTKTVIGGVRRDEGLAELKPIKVNQGDIFSENIENENEEEDDPLALRHGATGEEEDSLSLRDGASPATARTGRGAAKGTGSNCPCWRNSKVFRQILHDLSAPIPASFCRTSMNFSGARILAFAGLVSSAVSCAQVRPVATEKAPASPRWTNSLGMVFIPVPHTKVTFSVYETRVRDFAAFAATDPKLDGTNWNHAFYHGVTPVSPGPDYPVVNVSWNDATAFCAWLTETERAAGKIPAGKRYRLPTDEEWSRAVGIGDRETGATPKEKSAKLENVYPWGTQFPPPSGAGNFADQAALSYFTNWPHIDHYNDGFVTTSPVGSFTPGQSGLFDLAGNALEWCADFYDAAHKQRVLRGGAWNNCGPKSLLSSYREHVAPERYSVVTGFRCVLAENP